MTYQWRTVSKWKRSESLKERKEKKRKEKEIGYSKRSVKREQSRNRWLLDTLCGLVVGSGNHWWPVQRVMIIILVVTSGYVTSVQSMDFEGVNWLEVSGFPVAKCRYIPLFALWNAFLFADLVICFHWQVPEFASIKCEALCLSFHSFVFPVWLCCCCARHWTRLGCEIFA